MLRDADRSLAAWLGSVLPPGVGLRFEAPDARWAEKPPEPLLLDAYLHRVRQDDRAAESNWTEERDADGRVLGRRATPRYFRLGYLVTAWAGASQAGASANGGTQRLSAASERTLAEHELLGLLLDACVCTPVLPEDCLEGALAESGLPTALQCSPTHAEAATAALWSGLGLAARAHLELVLLVAVRPPALTDLAAPAREIVLNAAQEPGERRESAAFETGGTRRAPEFSTLRRWERQTTHEASAADRG